VVAMAAGLLVVAVAVAVVVRRAERPASGLGVVQVKLTTGDSFGERTLRLDAGDVVRLRVEPAGRLDTRMVVLLEEPAVESVSSFIGVDGINVTLNSGRMMINLKPLAARDASAIDWPWLPVLAVTMPSARSAGVIAPTRFRPPRTLKAHVGL